MKDIPSDFDPQQLWQAQPNVHAPVTLAELHARALAFQAQARRRRICSWIGIAAALAAMVWSLGRFTGWMMQFGALWTLAAGVLVLWRWQGINALEPLPGEGEALARAYRNNLVRLRDARRTVALWRIAPLLPGLALVALGRWFQQHAKGLPLNLDRGLLLLTVALAAVGLVVAYLRHQRAADELQRKIDELDGRSGR